MANRIVKTEMGKRNGGGRWMARADAKEQSDKVRRQNDQLLIGEQVTETEEGELDVVEETESD